MSELDPNSVEAILVDVMRDRGFRKKGLNWSLDHDGIVVTVNLQTSAWNARKRWGRHYLNISCFIRDLDEQGQYLGKTPPIHKGHISLRAGHLLPEHVDTIPCLDDDVSMSRVQRASEIEALLTERVLPMAAQLATRQGIVEAYSKTMLPPHFFDGGYGRVLPWIRSRV